MVEQLNLVDHDDKVAKAAFRLLLNDATPMPMGTLAERIGVEGPSSPKVFGPGVWGGGREGGGGAPGVVAPPPNPPHNPPTWGGLPFLGVGVRNHRHPRGGGGDRQ